jgi:hypothetical protein
MLGKDMVDYLTDVMEVKPSMIAAFLDVSQATLNKWQQRDTADVWADDKMRRLIKLYSFIQVAGSAVHGKWLINLLNEPLCAGGESVLGMIVDGPLEEDLTYEFCYEVIEEWLEDSL